MAAGGRLLRLTDSLRVLRKHSREASGSFSIKCAEYFSGFWLLPYEDGMQVVHLLNKKLFHQSLNIPCLSSNYTPKIMDENSPSLLQPTTVFYELGHTQPQNIRKVLSRETLEILAQPLNTQRWVSCPEAS